MRFLRTLSVLLLAAALAGCTRPAAEDPLYDVTLEGPAAVPVGTEAQFTMSFDGAGEATAHHMGAHMGHGAMPPMLEGEPHCTAAEDGADLPGTFHASCTFDRVGTSWVRAHAMVGGRESMSQHHMVIVFPENDTFAVTTDGLPTQVKAGEPVAFAVRVQGPPGNSTHFGAHFWNASQEDPTGRLGVASGCAHPAGDHNLPGTVTTSCVFPAPGTYYVRGHMRVEIGPERYNFWAEEQVVQAT